MLHWFRRNQPEDREARQKRQLLTRVNLLFLFAFVVFAVIIVRLAALQFVQGKDLALEEKGKNVKNVPLPPVRGPIYDASGVKLAYSTPTQSLYITLHKNYSSANEKTLENRPEIERIAEDIAAAFKTYGNAAAAMATSEIIDAMDLEYTKANGFTPRRIKKDLSPEEVAYFLGHKTSLPGVDVVEESIRHYDPDTVAVQAVGYMKKFNGSQDIQRYKEAGQNNNTLTQPEQFYGDLEDVGVDGLELQYQDELRGLNGYKQVQIDGRNMITGIEDTQAPAKGHGIVSTIHKGIQLKTEQAIMEQLNWLHTHPVSGETHKNAVTGFAVAMEVDTGNVVAMASMPDYDPAVWSSGEKSILPKYWKEVKDIYQNGTIKSFPSGQMRGNHPESVVLLGSTIKPLSVLIGLKEGLFRTGDVYQDQGIAYFGRNDSSSVKNSSGHVLGGLTPSRAIKESSNAFMVDWVGERLYNKYKATPGQGVDVWDKYMRQFGLGGSTGVDLPNEYLGYLEYKQNKKETALSKLAYASFGQQGRYTALQLAQYTATLANRGKRMEPHLVSSIKDASGNVVRTIKPKVLNEVQFPDAYWDTVIRGMATDVTAFNGFPYDYARKTGTSQQDVGKGKLVDNGVFIAFAPRENPKLAVAVMIPEGGFGAYSAGPVARKIFEAYDEVYGLTGVPRSNAAGGTAAGDK
ncbi:penicillin-binding transpeptidase domain-containing protein [Paenibacillus sp. JX-17]|uniref:Penicillin-binding transpeptidase domain-containing protein n=1 Tax=Paenibacillus lacisoli TaxID=3064525 RepID=A0ABT9CCU8_9BACL|nr:penicillin-binding transpeptidase domain-containing protein [Paenibacillus sp. JX-17]MDO7907079.1 penicillin-binding transpeptidase domain-containing protein [Paenibacillus sp. JX-17]